MSQPRPVCTRPRGAWSLLPFGLILSLAACASGEQRPKLDDGLYAELKTTHGPIYVRLEYERVPLTVANFVGLAEGTIEFRNRDAERYYDGLIFHRVIADFMIQGGTRAATAPAAPAIRFPTR